MSKSAFRIQSIAFLAGSIRDAHHPRDHRDDPVRSVPIKRGFLFIVFAFLALVSVAQANTITVKKGKKDTTITVDDKTKIMVGKAKKALADVKVGDKVTVHYAEAAAPAKEEKKAEKKMAPEKKEAAPAPAPAKPAAKKPAGGY